MFNNLLFDFSVPWAMGFQDPATPLMEGIIDLHHYIFFFITVIIIFTSILLLRLIDSFYIPGEEVDKKFSRLSGSIPYNFVSANLKASKFIHSSSIEIIWTIIPSIILILIAIPSFVLLYSMDEIVDPEITIKAIGHQWYWSYELTDYSKFGGEGINFDSFMIPEDELMPEELRLLEVDRPLILPARTHIRVIVGAADVLHSWAVPSLGVKIDAVPGRLNQTSMFIKRAGVYYGQCSEICGINHGFMPIVIHAIPTTIYYDPTGYLFELYKNVKNS